MQKKNIQLGMLLSCLVLGTCDCYPAQTEEVEANLTVDSKQNAPLNDRYQGYIEHFKEAISGGLTEKELNQIFDEYSDFVIPSIDTTELRNALQGKETKRLPLRNLKSELFYKSGIEQLINSPNSANRIFAYTTVASAADCSFNDCLLKAMKTEKEKGAKFWSGMALLYLQADYTSDLFDFLVDNEEFGDAHMAPLYLKLDVNSIRQTAYDKISSKDAKAKILAVQSLSVTGLNAKTDQLVKDAVGNWEPELKGFAIYTMKKLHMGGVKQILEPILKDKASSERSLVRIAMEALASSPSVEDQEYLTSLIPTNSQIPDDVLNAYLNSDKVEGVRTWLMLVRNKPVSPKYYFSAVVAHPLLASDELAEEVRTTIKKTVNHKVVAELCRALAGRSDNESVEVLINLLSDQDSTTRYWAASSLKGNKSPQLVAVLPELIRNPKLRTSALTELAVENKIDNLQDVYEAFIAPGSNAALEWRRSAGTYLAAFPKDHERDYFRSILQSKQEDSFLKRNAARALGELRDTASVDLIIAAMREEPPHDSNAISYLEALARIKGDKAQQTLESFKNSKIDSVRNLVLQLLKGW